MTLRTAVLSKGGVSATMPAPPVQQTELGDEHVPHPPLLGAGNLRHLSQPPKSTTDKMPRQAKHAAELMDLFYDLHGARKEGIDVDEELMDDLFASNVSDETRSFAGSIDAQLSDEYGMVYVKRNAQGEVIDIKAVFRGADTGEVAPLAKSVSGDAGRAFFGKENAAYTKFLEDNHFALLKKATAKYGMKPSLVYGHSMGGNAAARAVSDGLADHAVMLNPFTIDEMMQNGRHTVISTPRDPYNMMRKVVPQKANYNPHIQRIVLPDTTGKRTLMTAGAEGPSFLHAHSLERFTEGSIPDEIGDSILDPRLQGRNALFTMPDTHPQLSGPAAELAVDAGRMLERQQQAAVRSAARLKLAKGVGANVVGSLAASALLGAAGVDNEEVDNVVSNTAGGLAEGVLVTGEIGASVAGGAVAGIGTAEATYLADRVGVKGAGKVAMQVGLGLLSMVGFIFAPEVALPMLLAGGVAEGVDAAVQASAPTTEEEKVKKRELDMKNSVRRIVYRFRLIN